MFWATTVNSLGAEVICGQAGIVNLQEDISIVHSGREDLQWKGHRSWVEWPSAAKLRCRWQQAFAFMLLPKFPLVPTNFLHNSRKANLQESSFDPGLC